MAFLEQLFAIARNTFFECVRQAVTLIVVIAATLLVFLSNQFAAFTMSDDQRMFVDIALSTVFMAGAVLAAFLATSVVDDEIRNRTVLTVVSKPVARGTFVLGKYLGVCAALLASIAVPCMAFFLVEVHGVIQTAATPVGWPCVLFGISAAVVTVGTAGWCNFFYGKSFGALTIMLGGPMLLLAYTLSLLFDPQWNVIELSKEFRGELWAAAALMSMALAILAAIAIAASTRLGQILTIGVTIGVLVLGLLSDWVIGRRIQALEKALAIGGDAGSAPTIIDQLGLFAAKLAYAAIPNFQVFWMVDAVNQAQPIPLDYFVRAIGYGALFVIAANAIAIALFQRREVG
jgi:ABC-type transport system involved in multi-copper enzyme maturation permease subunit